MFASTDVLSMLLRLRMSPEGRFRKEKTAIFRDTPTHPCSSKRDLLVNSVSGGAKMIDISLEGNHVKMAMFFQTL